MEVIPPLLSCPRLLLTLPGKFVSLCQILLNVPHVLEARYLWEISVGRGAKGYVQRRPQLSAEHKCG